VALSVRCTIQRQTSPAVAVQQPLAWPVAASGRAIGSRSPQQSVNQAWQMSPDLPALTLDDVTRSEDPFATLNALLGDYNAAHVGRAMHVPLWLFARDAAGKVQGGVRGQTYWSWCSIDVLTVAEPYRRQGIGSRLLAFKRPRSIAATATSNSVASMTIRRATRGSGS